MVYFSGILASIAGLLEAVKGLRWKTGRPALAAATGVASPTGTNVPERGGA